MSAVLPGSGQPFTTIHLPEANWYRVHAYSGPGKYDPDQFNGTNRGDARFSPLVDPATGDVIPTMYAAETPAGAIAEIILRNAPMPSTGYIHDWKNDVDGIQHMSLLKIGPLHLANLTSTGLQAAGVAHSTMFTLARSTYPSTRDWALWIWQNMPDVHGLTWMSVRDSTSKVIMLFEDRVKASAGNPGVTLARLKGPHHIKLYEDAVFGLLILLGASANFAL